MIYTKYPTKYKNVSRPNHLTCGGQFSERHGLISVGGNNPSKGGWIHCATTCNPVQGEDC